MKWAKFLGLFSLPKTPPGVPTIDTALLVQALRHRIAAQADTR